MLFFSSGIEEYPERVENELESQFILWTNPQLIDAANRPEWPCLAAENHRVRLDQTNAVGATAVRETIRGLEITGAYNEIILKRIWRRYGLYL
jgi:hypothetical protein